MVKITILNTSRGEFDTYYFALIDAGWTLDGTLSTGTFSAIDPSNRIKLELEYVDGANKAHLEITEVQIV